MKVESELSRETKRNNDGKGSKKVMVAEYAEEMLKVHYILVRKCHYVTIPYSTQCIG